LDVAKFYIVLIKHPPTAKATSWCRPIGTPQLTSLPKSATQQYLFFCGTIGLLKT